MSPQCDGIGDRPSGDKVQTGPSCGKSALVRRGRRHPQVRRRCHRSPLSLRREQQTLLALSRCRGCSQTRRAASLRQGPLLVGGHMSQTKRPPFFASSCECAHVVFASGSLGARQAPVSLGCRAGPVRAATLSAAGHRRRGRDRRALQYTPRSRDLPAAHAALWPQLDAHLPPAGPPSLHLGATED